MITRTTTIGSLKSYRYNLNHSMTTMADSMGKITTGREFNSFAESPAIAARAFQLRNAYLRTSSQYEVNDALVHKYEEAWSALDGVEKDIDTIDNSGFYNLIRAENGADASGRNALGQDMSAKAKSIVQTMNRRYGENYVFAGADTLNVPFTWEAKLNPNYVADPNDPIHFEYETADGGVTNNIWEAAFEEVDNPAYLAAVDEYNAAIAEGRDDVKHPDDVSCPQIPKKIKEYKTRPYPDYDPGASYKYLKSSAVIDGVTKNTYTNDEAEAMKVLCYRGVPVDANTDADTDALKYYTEEEKKYIDIGLGYQEIDGAAVPSSVKDSALQGVYYLGGYGTSEVTVELKEGDPSTKRTVTVPNNIVSIMSRLGEIMQNCSPDDGKFASEDEKAEFLALAEKYEDASSLVKQRYIELDTTTSFLKDNGELLINNADSLQDQFLGLEDVNPAGAISDFMFARYAYDTALKVGNTVLSQSLMDYMSF